MYTKGMDLGALALVLSIVFFKYLVLRPYLSCTDCFFFPFISLFSV